MTMDTLPPLTDDELHAQYQRSLRQTEAQYIADSGAGGPSCTVHPPRKLNDGSWDGTCNWHKQHSITCACSHCLYVDYCDTGALRTFLDDGDPIYAPGEYTWFHGLTPTGLQARM